MMKRIALLVVLASMSTACGTALTKGGARGPQIQRTADAPVDHDLSAERPDVGQR